MAIDWLFHDFPICFFCFFSPSLFELKGFRIAECVFNVLPLMHVTKSSVIKKDFHGWDLFIFKYMNSSKSTVILCNPAIKSEADPSIKGFVHRLPRAKPRPGLRLINPWLNGPWMPPRWPFQNHGWSLISSKSKQYAWAMQQEHVLWVYYIRYSRLNAQNI